MSSPTRRCTYVGPSIFENSNKDIIVPNKFGSNIVANILLDIVFYTFSFFVKCYTNFLENYMINVLAIKHHSLPGSSF